VSWREWQDLDDVILFFLCVICTSNAVDDDLFRVSRFEQRTFDIVKRYYQTTDGQTDNGGGAKKSDFFIKIMLKHIDNRLSTLRTDIHIVTKIGSITGRFMV
jgi:hypothetical protein